MIKVHNVTPVNSASSNFGGYLNSSGSSSENSNTFISSISNYTVNEVLTEDLQDIFRFYNGNIYEFVGVFVNGEYTTIDLEVELAAEPSNWQQKIISHEVNIQGALVLSEGKTDLNNFETNDSFRYQTDLRYCVGIIIDATDITLPTDLDNPSKIKLQYDG
jgi:hypothetical protein